MGKPFGPPRQTPIGRDWPKEFAKHQARVREEVQKALEVLKREPPPDTFLGRQHYALIPLPYERE